MADAGSTFPNLEVLAIESERLLISRSVKAKAPGWNAYSSNMPKGDQSLQQNRSRYSFGKSPTVAEP